MLSPFLYQDRPIHLDRFPRNQVNRSLQAWDAADEYLISYLEENNLLSEELNILVLNDNFGALSINLSNYSCTLVTDSIIAEQGTRENFSDNLIDQDKLTILDSMAELPLAHYDLVLLKIPKSKALLEHQLIVLQSHTNESSKIIAAARAKDIHSSTLKQFEKHLGETSTSLAVKKARLVFCQRNEKIQSKSPYPTVWPLENTAFEITNFANVFAREKLDLGARFFIPHLPKVEANQRIVDLGCGNGVLGLTLLAEQPDLDITFTDESYMAIASAKLNIEKQIDGHKNCQFIVQDSLSEQESNSIDTIICNPPFHQQHSVTDHIAWQMFNDSYRVLKKGGELRIIGNRNLGYHIKLKRIFKNCKTIASDKKFIVLSAFK